MGKHPSEFGELRLPQSPTPSSQTGTPSRFGAGTAPAGNSVLAADTPDTYFPVIKHPSEDRAKGLADAYNIGVTPSSRA